MSPWSPRRRAVTVPKTAQLCLHQEQLISQSGLPQCVRLSRPGREEEQLCLQHCPWTTTQPGRGQRLAGGDDKHSQPNAELAKGRQVRMQCAPVDSTPAPQRLALLNKNSRHGSTMRIHVRTTAHTPATVRGATGYSDPPAFSRWRVQEALNAVLGVILRTFEHFVVEATHGRVARGGVLARCTPGPALAPRGPGSLPLPLSHRSKYIFRLACTLPLRLA